MGACFRLMVHCTKRLALQTQSGALEEQNSAFCYFSHKHLGALVTDFRATGTRLKVKVKLTCA